MTVATAIWSAVKLSRRLQVALAAFLAFLGWHGWLAVHDRGVRKQVAHSISQKHVKVADKAGKAREAAKVPGAIDRLKDRYCEGACK